MDDYVSLYNRLLNRCPDVGAVLAGQFVNDAWHQLQGHRPEWSFRRRSSVFSPPTLYNQGLASTNSGVGAPTLITGLNTGWTPDMIGRQIRIGGLLYPFYTITGWLSATQLLIDKPWSGADVQAQSYTIQQNYFSVPDDFGFFYALVSIKDGYRLWTNLSQADIDLLDPQRTNFGQTYAAVFHDYAPIYGGTIGPAMALIPGTAASPVSTTTTGFTYPIDASYLIQISAGGVSGVATFQWLRMGQSTFSFPVVTDQFPIDLSDGVQVYFPDGGTNYQAGWLYIINCRSLVSVGTPRYELWPAPTFQAYLYPYVYIAKISDVTDAAPQLPPFIATRGEVLLEMALEKCSEFPGSDSMHPNIYHDLRQAQYHRGKWLDMLVDIEREDEEVGTSLVDYQKLPMYPGPWWTGQWQQSHAPFLNS